MSNIDFQRDLLPLKDKIYRLGLRITLNTQEAEDLTQDILIRLWNKREELSHITNIEVWSLTITRNLALDRIAQKGSQNISLESVDTDTSDQALNPDEILEQKERLHRVHQLFKTLPENLRTALQLRDIEGLSYHEAAIAMQMTEENYKVTLHRARKTLKTQYEKIEKYGL